MTILYKNTKIRNTKIRNVNMADFGLPQAKQWFNPNLETLIDFGTGDFIDVIGDASGTGNDGSTVAETNQPTLLRNEFNGNNVIKFIGISDILNFATKPMPSGNSPYTIVLVIKSDNINSSNVLLTGGNVLATDRSLHFLLNGNVFQTDWYNNAINSSTTLDTVNYWSLISDYDGTDRNHYTNGGNDANDTPGTRNSSSVAAQNMRGNNNLNMYVGEYIMFDKLLSPTEKAQTDRYVLKKFGI